MTDWNTGPGDPIADLNRAAEAMRNERHKPIAHVVSPAYYRGLLAYHARVRQNETDRDDFERRIDKVPGALALSRRPFFWRLWWRWHSWNRGRK